MKLWKVVGLAGLAGVAATGVIIARDQRQRAQLTPDEVRSRLHARLEGTAEGIDSGIDSGAEGTDSPRPTRD